MTIKLNIDDDKGYTFGFDQYADALVKLKGSKYQEVIKDATVYNDKGDWPDALSGERVSVTVEMPKGDSLDAMLAHDLLDQILASGISPRDFFDAWNRGACVLSRDEAVTPMREKLGLIDRSKDALKAAAAAVVFGDWQNADHPRHNEVAPLLLLAANDHKAYASKMEEIGKGIAVVAENLGPELVSIAKILVAYEAFKKDEAKRKAAAKKASDKVNAAVMAAAEAAADEAIDIENA
jgi:hypothetical protein